MKRRFVIAAALGLPVLIAGGGAWFLLATESGARWLLDRAGAALTYAGLDGTVAGGLTITGLDYSQPGVRITASSVYAEAGVGWSGIRIRRARVTDLTIGLSSAGGDACVDCEPDIRAALDGLVLPVPLRIDAFEIATARIVSDERPVFALDRLVLAGRWSDSIVLDRFELDSSLVDAGARGRLGLREPHALELGLEALIAAEATGLPGAADVDLEASGSLDDLSLIASSRALGADLDARVSALLDTPAWDAELQLSDIALPLAADAELTLSKLQLDSAGSIERYSLDLVASIGSPEAVDVMLAALGSPDRLTIRRLEAVHADGTVVADGVVDFPDAFELDLRITEFSPRRWLEGWPDDRPVRGNASLSLDAGELRVERGGLRVAAAAADFEAAYHLDSEMFSLALDWRELAWPLDGDPGLVSPRGQAKLDGRPDDWTATASFGLAAPGVADGRLSLAAAGNRTTATIGIEDGQVLGGTIGGQARFMAGDAPGWELDLELRSIDSGALFAEWPGSVSATVAGRGAVDEASITLRGLAGTLLDRPLAGGGSVAYRDGTLRADEFALTHGDAELRIDGALDAGDGLGIAFTLPALDVYPLPVAGDLAASGRLRLAGAELALNIDANSDTLRAGGVELEALRIATVRLEGDAGTGFSASALRVAAADRVLEDLELELCYTDSEQTLDLGFASGRYRTAVLASGALDDPRTPLTSTWRGVLSRFDIIDGEGPVTSLLESVPVTASRDALRIERLCLTGADPGELCARIAWSQAAGIDASMALTSIPIDLVNLAVDTGFDFEQRLSGELGWRQPTGFASATASAAFTLTPGDAVSRRYADTELATGPGELAFELEDGVLRSGLFRLPLEADGLLRAELGQLDIVSGGRGPVRASLDATASDIGFLAAFVPGVERLEGEVDADFDLTGTLDAPELSGRARLGNAAALYAPLGTRISDAQLDLTVAGNGRVTVDGGFRAGDGQASIVTQAATSGTSLVNVRIRGDDLALIDVPDVRATADADLAVEFTPGRLDVNGRIGIPAARIYPVNLATGRVDESEDVVIVAGALPEEPGVARAAEALAVFGELRLDMGDDVIVDLDLATARLEGSAVFEWTEEPIPVGRGRYDLTGSVEAFGQVLDISEGAIRFPNGPADNPLIRLRATREIYGNSEVKRAGVLIDGPLERPSIEAYTEPPTSEERAATLLLTGNDFNFEEGVGAVDFGTYVAPRLFLSYGVGVFDRENVISARYDLNEGFGIRATSGDRESGVDLTYRIER